MKCFNKNVLIGLGTIALVVLLLKPSWMLAALPLLILAVCPLSMIFMMRHMPGQPGNSISSDTRKPAGGRRRKRT